MFIKINILDKKTSNAKSIQNLISWDTLNYMQEQQPNEFYIRINNKFDNKMRRNQKKTIKKNLFDDDEDQNEVKACEQPNKFLEQQPLSSKKAIGKTGERYDAHQIKENEHYLGKKQASNQLSHQQKEIEQINSKKKAKFTNKKKKNLFESDEQGEQKKEQENQQQEISVNNKKTQIAKFVQDQSPQKNKESQQQKHVESEQEQDIVDQEDQQDQRRQQNINELIKNTESKIDESKKSKQVSFSRLIEKVQSDRDELKRLIYEPIPKGFKASCIFKRVPNGMSQNFQLIMEDDQKCLMFCENQRGSIGANYYISLTKEMDKNASSYLGKLRGNSTGSLYQLYDGGKQPQKKINRKQWRCSMGRIQYQTNILGMNGPRKLKVILPNVKNMQQYDSFKLNEDEQLTNFQSPVITKYRNKQPRWNDRLKSYALNFGGKVKQASIKNFILVNEQVSAEEQFNATNHLVFGKIDENNFSLEAIFPLSIYQAFGIVMSEFDFKLNCQ